MNWKNLEAIWNQVPADYYQIGIQSNLFQFIWHTLKLSTFKYLISSKNPKTILDVGCAGGDLTIKISQILPETNIVAIDVYKDAINYATKQYPNINFKVADAHYLPFKTASFDLVISYETIEHVIDPIKVLSEIKRVLKPKGHAIIAMDSGSLLFRIVWYFWEKTKGKVWGGAHLHPFHHNELEMEIKRVGFKIQKKHFSHFGMEVSFVLSK